MNRYVSVVCLLCSIITLRSASAQPILEFTPRSPLPSPVAVTFEVDLDGLTTLPDSALQLYSVLNSSETPIPFQVRPGLHRDLYWTVEAGDSADSFRLRAASSMNLGSDVSTRMVDGLLEVEVEGATLLGYQFGVMAAPASVDPAYARSGFIHPLYTPDGKLLTRVQPEDHYHHYGIWNPWTQTEYKGEVVDFWNLAKREGTVRFAGFISRIDGPVFSEFQVHHEHVVYREEGEEVAMNELQTWRVYRPSPDGYYVIDFTSEFSPTTSPLRLLEYRYGGLGWRGPEGWTHANSTVLTSEGRSRVDADGSTARWISVTGGPEGDMYGLVIMSHNSNYNHPEPLRVWPPEQHEHGDVFVNFSPTKTKAWLLEPGQRYALRYRFVAFDGEMSEEKIEHLWHEFVQPARVEVESFVTDSQPVN